MSREPITLAYATAPREPRWRPLACFLVLLAGLQVCFGNRIQLSQWQVSGQWNAGVAEGDAWLNGRLDIPHAGRDAARDRMHDTAFFNGRVFNVFPPLMGFLTLALGPLHHLLLGRSDFWLPWLYTLICFWPIPIVGYFVFRKLSGDSAWGALLTAGWIGATPLLPNLYFARNGLLGQTNHVLSQIGLLLIAVDVLGRQRLWPALIGLAIAAWSRQLTLLYALPILWCAFQSRARERPALGALEHNEPVACARGSDKRRIIFIFAALALIITPLLTLNYLKFNNPLDFGYRHIYVYRIDEMAVRCRTWGTFSPRFIMDNARYMFAELPYFSLTPTSVQIDGKQMGISIFFTSPFLLLPLLTARLWWSDPRRRLLMLGTLPVIAGLMCYHSPGFMQVGYNRFALDFIPIWLAVIAPYTRQGWRAWFTLVTIAWGMLYFSLMRFD